MNTILAFLPWLIIAFLSLGMLIAVMNVLFLPRLDSYAESSSKPLLSVLIPARNEEANIEKIVRSMMAQDYPNFELLVLNDNSTDRTSAILAQLARQFPRLKVLHGAPLPEGWMGKHWACHQLTQAAQGEYLLLTDADTEHTPTTLSDSMNAALAEHADLLTAFPHQQLPTLGEKLIVPAIYFGMIAFMPAVIANHSHIAAFSSSHGQFMLFRRTALERIGGYEGVRMDVLDDVMLGRKLVNMGMEWRMMDATRHVESRMYHGFWEAVDGFTKNLFTWFGSRITPLVLAIAWLWTAFIGPFTVLVLAALGMRLDFFPLQLAAVAWLQGLLIWSLAYTRARLPLWQALYYPLTLALFLLTALRSGVYSIMGWASWKGRTLERPAWRW